MSFLHFYYTVVVNEAWLYAIRSNRNIPNSAINLSHNLLFPQLFSDAHTHARMHAHAQTGTHTHMRVRAHMPSLTPLSAWGRLHCSPWLLGPPSPSSQSVMLLSAFSPPLCCLETPQRWLKSGKRCFLSPSPPPSSSSAHWVFGAADNSKFDSPRCLCRVVSLQEDDESERWGWRSTGLTCTPLLSMCHLSPLVSLSQMTTFIMYSEGIIPPRPPRLAPHAHLSSSTSSWATGGLESRGAAGQMTEHRLLRLSSHYWCPFETDDTMPFILALLLFVAIRFFRLFFGPLSVEGLQAALV